MPAAPKPPMSDASLHTSLSQQQTLSPQMRKSLEILQANTMELGQIIQQALEANPVLEESIESISLDAEREESLQNDPMEELRETDDDWRERSILDNRASPWTSDDEERRQWLHDSMVAPVTLQQHLQQQLDLSLVEPDIRNTAKILLGSLDERGFFDTPPRDIASRMGISPKILRAALELIQSFDPAGVGATSLADSLRIQLDRQGHGESIEGRIVREHLEDLARKRFPQIAKALGTSIDRITEAATHISRLNPNPGGDFNPTGNPYIQPDVIIEADDNGHLSARLSGENLPQLRINDFYKDMIGDQKVDNKARQFLRDQIRDGRSLIRFLSLRQETILAIANQLIDKQRTFFLHGPRHLRPLTMHEIAESLGMHATTVSRAVAGKYLLSPQGLTEMRSFFATGYQTEDGNEVSNTGVREALQQLVANENPAKPLSDEALMKSLATQGITVARRTVAKYREQLNILPSHLRKSFSG